MSFDGVHSKRLLVSYAERLERVQKGGRRRRGSFLFPFLLSSQLSGRTRAETLAMQTGHLTAIVYRRVISRVSYYPTQLDQHSASYICRSYKFFKLEVISIFVFRRYLIFLMIIKKRIDNSNNNNNDNISYLNTVKLTCRKNLVFFHRSYLVEEI